MIAERDAHVVTPTIADGVAVVPCCCLLCCSVLSYGSVVGDVVLYHAVVSYVVTMRQVTSHGIG